jgi:hypothetical protein
MLRVRRLFLLDNPFNRLSVWPSSKWAQRFSKRQLIHAARVMGPALIAVSFASVAHAQGTMDFSGAQTLMGTFNSRFAYVSVSRASHEAQIYTNDAASLAKILSHDVTKASAIDFGKVPVGNVGLEQASALRKTTAPGLVIAL